MVDPSHTIRLRGPWTMRLGSVEAPAKSPISLEPGFGDYTLVRPFHWTATLDANERVFAIIEAAPDNFVATLRINGVELPLRRTNLGIQADITDELAIHNNLELQMHVEERTEFVGIILAAVHVDHPVWNPTPEHTAGANITRFREMLQSKGHAVGKGYFGLHQWSIQHREDFWSSVWDFGGVVAQEKGHRFLLSGDTMPGAKWFPDAKLNFAENLLRRRDGNEAIVFWNEYGRQRAVTFAELFDEVGRLQGALKKAGVGTGDRIAVYMPNMPENVAMMLAVASLGAIWSSCSPDFGEAGALDRLGQLQPKILLAADGYFFKGKSISVLDRVRNLSAKIESIEKVVVVGYCEKEPDLSSIPNAIKYEDFCKEPFSDLEFKRLPFDHPLYILFSSGTTGVPKGIVHGAGGTLLQHLKELMLHADIKRNDRVFYATTCGWMMWNWLISALALEATIVLYDGSPFHPTEDILWKLAEEEKLTHFGTSAKYLSAAEKAGVEPKSKYRLESLRAIFSTGSPLAATGFDYVYRAIKPDVCLSSISGGTDIVSCFALGNPTLPVYRGELQCAGLGMAVEVFDPNGAPLGSGCGELVCTKAFPSMPVSFWNDADGSKYRAAYFDVFPNVWRHGDFIERTKHGGFIIHGRSDAVLNPSGVRIGTAEIYRQVEQVPAVLESLAVGQPWDGDERIVLFVRLAEGTQLDSSMVKEIKDRIRAGASPRHVPSKIIHAPDLPRTLNAKIAELAVRDLIAGRTVRNAGALANPESLEFFKDIPELKTD